MNPMNMTEKILSSKLGRKVEVGEFVVVPVDFVYAHDGTAPLSIKVMNEIKELNKVFDPSRIAFIIDHAAPSPTVFSAHVHIEMRSFAKRFGIRLYDVGNGICHQVIAESGLIRPGMVVVGADSHTVTLGALGAFATGVGSTDAAIAMTLGKLWMKVPETIKVVINGKPKPWVLGKDIILHIIGSLGVDAATYKSVEFLGESLKYLTMDSRMTLSNMSVEMGAKAGLIPVDEVTKAWFKSLGINNIRTIRPDPGAEYEDEVIFDVAGLEPQVALPPNIDNVKPVTEVEGIEIDQVFIGSCTNGRFEDFLIASRIFKGRRVKDGVRCIAIPASRSIYLRLLREGIIEILVSAGCFVAHSTCGPCIGAHLGLLGGGEVAISTSNRNFIGRMGHKDSKVFLASPATAAASAIEGKIVDPSKYLGR